MIGPRTFRLLSDSSLIQRNYLALPFILLVFFLATAHCALGQQEPAKVLHLGKVEVIGLERFTQEQVVTASGLQIGQAIDIPAADEAADRLMSSGLFKKLSYRFRSTGNQVTVTFQVEETKETVPVIFDNFVWFSEQELLDAVRREVPSFDGTASESGAMADNIQKALQQFLNARKIQGHVEYLSAADAAGKHSAYLFSIKGIKIPICALHFPGAKDLKESDLVNASKPLFEQDYSRGDVQTFARINLLPLYRQRGHLRASFLAPEVKPQTDADCQNGVSVTLQVDERDVYTWDKADWSGNEALSAQELSAALGMKTGEVANGLKIDKGGAALAEAYGKKGYIEARVAGQPEFDDVNRRVAYRYSITEGPQYRMGAVEFKGLSEELITRLTALWKLQPGEVFDTSYYETFMKKAMIEVAGSGLRLQGSHAEYKPNRDNRTVNVVIDFK